MSWLVHPGSVSSSLFTGILGVQPRPTIGETAGLLIYAIRMLAYVLLPDRWFTWQRRRTSSLGPGSI